ncbi:MAG: zinc ABC transporter substrate-binding protein [Acidobacteriota bacterium]|nr:MAG: zinc ABC transporter substrate-binding protein [Acidobacteriota bacterium]
MIFGAANLFSGPAGSAALRGWRAAVGVAVAVTVGCSGDEVGPTERLPAVATTTIVADLVREIGGPDVSVVSLMGPGIDPHLFKPSEGDIARMSRAAIVFYSGLHLEGKMTEVFERMRQLGRPTVPLAECVPVDKRLTAAGFSGVYDPHVWFDVGLWKHAASCVSEALSEHDPRHADAYRERGRRYLERLDALEAAVRRRIEQVPAQRRVLVTAHDAFAYFGRAYGIEVRGLLGVSTAAEAGAADVQELADFITERRIPAMFVESSVPERYVQALREAVESRGWQVSIGGTLFSDALGDPQTPAGSYIGTVRHNVETIVAALSEPSGAGHER